MNATLRFLALAILLGTAAYALEQDNTMVSKAYSFSAGALPLTADGVPNSLAKKIPGTDGFDVRPFLETQGMVFPEGSEAIFFPKTRGLLFRNTPAYHELLESLIGQCGLGTFLEMRVTLSVVSFRIGKSVEDLQKLDYSRLKAAAGQSWKEIATLSGMLRSGNPVLLEHLAGKTDELSLNDELPVGVFGSRARVDIFIGPDGVTSGTEVEFRFRDKTDSDITEFSYSGGGQIRMGEPAIIKLDVNCADGRGLALVLVASYLALESPKTGIREKEATAAPSPQPQ